MIRPKWPGGGQRRFRIGAAAYDRKSGPFYVLIVFCRASLAGYANITNLVEIQTGQKDDIALVLRFLLAMLVEMAAYGGDPLAAEPAQEFLLDNLDASLGTSDHLVLLAVVKGRPVGLVEASITGLHPFSPLKTNIFKISSS